MNPAGYRKVQSFELTNMKEHGSSTDLERCEETSPVLVRIQNYQELKMTGATA